VSIAGLELLSLHDPRRPPAMAALSPMILRREPLRGSFPAGAFLPDTPRTD